MTLPQAIILGIVQGLTEFLPISSSAHLVIVPFLLGWKIPTEQVFPFDVLIQLGTLLAVIIYFWKDLWGILKAFILGLVRLKPFADPQARLGWLLILATIPAVFFGLLVKSKVEAAFNSVAITAAFLFVTALLLLAAEYFGKRNRPLTSIRWLDALVMGFFQALSVFPGISRSGSTIAGGMLRHLDRAAAARFSFLMSIPVMLGAGVLEVKDVLAQPNLTGFLPLIAIGFVASAVVGYFSIRWMLAFIMRHSYRAFAVYCCAIGLLTLAIFFLTK